MVNREDIQTFIFVHDQNIILSYEEEKIFKNIEYTYVFLGTCKTDMLFNTKNIIYAKDLPYNLEDYPKMCSYSGWYVLFKNNLITAKYVNLFEYDIILSDDFMDKLMLNIDNKTDYYGYAYIGLNNCFLYNEIQFGEISKYYSNLQTNIIDKSKEKNIDVWCITSNVTMKNDFFYKYMSDTEDFFYWVKAAPRAGHELERCLSTYHILNNDILNVKYLDKENILKHCYKNSHNIVY